jgi:acyl carrier protein
MQTREDIRRELKSLVSYMLEIDDFADHQHFTRDLGADSMMLVEIAARIEKKYTVQIPEGELREVRSLGDAVRVVGDALQLPK